MKVSAAVLLTVSSASAFNVGYLNQLGGGVAAVGKPAPVANVAPAVGGPASYLDNLNPTPELVSAIEAAPVAPVAAAPVAPAPVAAAPAAAAPSPVAADYLSALGGGSPISGGGLTGYLDALVGGIVPTSGGGLTGYLDALPAAAAPISGSGLTSYLDAVSPAAPAPVAPVAAAPAAPAAAAPVAAAAVAEAPAAGDYLSHLDGGHSLSGAGLTTHVDTLATNSAPTGAGLQGYLGALGINASATSGAGITGYADALATTSALAGEAPSAAGAPPSAGSVSSFLESVYGQIVAQGLAVEGANGSVTYASADGPYAMSFVKN